MTSTTYTDNPTHSKPIYRFTDLNSTSSEVIIFKGTPEDVADDLQKKWNKLPSLTHYEALNKLRLI